MIELLGITEVQATVPQGGFAIALLLVLTHASRNCVKNIFFDNQSLFDSR